MIGCLDISYAVVAWDLDALRTIEAKFVSLLFKLSKIILLYVHTAVFGICTSAISCWKLAAVRARIFLRPTLILAAHLFSLIFKHLQLLRQEEEEVVCYDMIFSLVYYKGKRNAQFCVLDSLTTYEGVCIFYLVIKFRRMKSLKPCKPCTMSTIFIGKSVTHYVSAIQFDESLVSVN